MDKGYLILPVAVTSRVDVGRLLREVQALQEFLQQAAIREPGTSVKMPKTSRLLDEFITTNKINPLHQDDRLRMQNFLVSVRAKAPIMHMSFSADPSASFVQKLTAWLRKEIHPMVLVQVGLQPSIGAGCILRTTNKHFDFSLRQHFQKKRELLVAKMREGVPMDSPAPVAAPVQPAPTPAPVVAAASAPTVSAAPNATAPEVAGDLAKVVDAAIAALEPGAAPEKPVATTTAPAPTPQGQPHE